MPMLSEPGGGPKRPKGYAFVTVPRHADPSVAIDALDQSETFPGAKHPLKVSLAKKNDVWANRDRDDDRSGTKRRRDDRGDTRGGNKGGVPPGKSPERLYILGLPTRITEVLLKEVYSQFGSVVDARVLRSRDGEEGGPKRGQVTFAAASDAAKAKAATDNTRAFHGGGELRVVHANLREGETRKDGGGARARQGTAMQPWQVYPMQPGIPLYTPMVPVMVDPDTGQPIVPRTRPIVNDEGGKKAPESGKSAAGYTGIHLAGLPPSATVDAKYAHLYQ
jgi:nucleolin